MEINTVNVSSVVSTEVCKPWAWQAAGWWEHSHYSQPEKLSPTEARPLSYRRWLWFHDFCGGAVFLSLAVYLKAVKAKYADTLIPDMEWKYIKSAPIYEQSSASHIYGGLTHTAEYFSPWTFGYFGHLTKKKKNVQKLFWLSQQHWLFYKHVQTYRTMCLGKLFLMCIK